MCGRPAAAVVPGGLRAGERLICGKCVEVASEHTGDTTEISAEDLAEMDTLTGPELTSEEEYAQALDAEQRYELEPAGTLTEIIDDPTRAQAWGYNPGTACGRP